MVLNLKTLFKEVENNKFILFQNIIDKVSFFLIFLILARTLQNDDFGKIITIFTLCNAIAVFFNFGLPIYIQRLAAQMSNKIKEAYNASLLLNLFSFFVYFPTVIFFSNLLFVNLDIALVFIIALTVFIAFASSTQYGYLSGLKKFRTVFFIICISRLSALILISVLLLFKVSSPVYLIIPVLLSGILHFFLQYFSSKSELNKTDSLKIRTENIISLLKVTFPLYFAVVFNFLYDKIDVLIISKLLNYSELSYYSVGYGIFKSSSLAFSFLLVGGLSKASYLSRSKKGIWLFFKKYAIIILAITIPIFLLAFLFPESIVSFIYGEEYFHSAFILRWLSPAIIILGLNNLTGILLNAFGMFKENMIVTLTGLIINIILNILFLNYYGIVVSVIATILTEFIILAGGIFYFINKLKI